MNLLICQHRRDVSLLFLSLKEKHRVLILMRGFLCMSLGRLLSVWKRFIQSWNLIKKSR